MSKGHAYERNPGPQPRSPPRRSASVRCDSAMRTEEAVGVALSRHLQDTAMTEVLKGNHVEISAQP
jgi:hypothetical protein